MSVRLSNQLALVNTFADLGSLLETATVTANFMGSRRVKVQGYLGDVPLSLFTAKIEQKLEQNLYDSVRDPDHYQVEDNRTIENVTNKVYQLYQNSDAQLAHRNIFTRAMNFLGEILTHSWRTASFHECFIDFDNYFKKALNT